MTSIAKKYYERKEERENEAKIEALRRERKAAPFKPSPMEICNCSSTMALFGVPGHEVDVKVPPGTTSTKLKLRNTDYAVIYVRNNFGIKKHLLAGCEKCGYRPGVVLAENKRAKIEPPEETDLYFPDVHM